MSTPLSNEKPSPKDANPVPAAQDAFAQSTEPYRRQIKAYCYRMVGSLHEAEDLTQETFLKAWRAFDGFEARGSLKAWLYQIATRVCLDAIRQKKRLRRILPDMGLPPATSIPAGQPPVDVPWLEPYPDAELDNVADDALGPDAQYEKHETVRLAFVAAIQYLPPRQRAVLLLIDVLGWSPAETATLIGGSVASVNSALQRARATMVRHYPKGPPEQYREIPRDQSILLDRYVQAWEAKDLDGFVALLKEEAVYVMPPWPQWYFGRDAIHAFFEAVWQRYGRFRILRTAANRQPAFVLYTENTIDGTWAAHSIHVLTADCNSISRLTIFMKPMGPGLVEAFQFPLVMSD